MTENNSAPRPHNDNPIHEIDSQQRRLIFTLVGGSAFTGPLVTQWTKPVVRSFILPAHAATSPELPPAEAKPLATTPVNAAAAGGPSEPVLSIQTEPRLGIQSQPSNPPTITPPQITPKTTPVATAPLQVSITSPSEVITLDNAVPQRITARAHGGRDAAYTYSWFVAAADDTPQHQTRENNGEYTFVQAPNQATTYTVTVTVTNAAKQTATASLSIHVNNLLSAFTGGDTSIANGSAHRFYAQATGGGRYMYSWQVVAKAAPNIRIDQTSGYDVTEYTLRQAPRQQTTYTVRVTITDSAHPGTAVTRDTEISVNALSVAIAPSSASMKAGRTQTLTAAVGGGASYDYRWQVDGVAQTATTPTFGFSRSPSVATTYRVTVTATDKADSNVTATSPAVEITVAPLVMKQLAASFVYFFISGVEDADGNAIADPITNPPRAATDTVVFQFMVRNVTQGLNVVLMTNIDGSYAATTTEVVSLHNVLTNTAIETAAPSINSNGLYRLKHQLKRNLSAVTNAERNVYYKIRLVEPDDGRYSEAVNVVSQVWR